MRASAVPGSGVRARPVVWLLHVALPLLFLWLVLANRRFDVHWEHHTAHFWLVAGAALLNVGIAMVVVQQAHRHDDARLFLVGLGYIGCAGFLGLHALATPGVLLDIRTNGFVIATPVGLLIGSLFALASSVELTAGRARAVLRWRVPLAGGLGAVLVVWGALSLLGLPPLDAPSSDDEAQGAMTVMAVAGSAFYGVAALRYFALHRRRRSVMLVSVITSFVLLAEALLVVTIARAWRASWWEWHVLMATAFALVAYSAYAEYRREGSATGLFQSVALERTVRALQEEYGSALEALVTAMDRRDSDGDGAAPIAPLAAGVGRRFGLTEGQTRVLTRAAEALADEREQLRRLDALVAVGREASVIRPEHELLAHAADVLGDAFGRDTLELAVLEGGALRPRTGRALPIAATGGAGRRAIETLEPQREATGHGEQLVLPLTVKGNAAGVVTVARPHGTFDERDVAILRSVAAELSIALENARLYHQLDGLFRQYMSPDVATALLADPGQASLGGAVKEVSVLFADLHGFTSFSERTAPEDVVGLLNTYFGAIVPIILGEGGTVTQFAGDAVMAVFNAPVTQPDHAMRAVRAGLALPPAIEVVAAGHEDWPRFRVGVNTGPALVGNIGGREVRNFTAIGDTTNTAARLESSAPVGGVVISETTYARVRDEIHAEPLGVVQAKGKAGGVAAYRVLGVRQPVPLDRVGEAATGAKG